MYIRIGPREREKLADIPVWKLWVAKDSTTELIRQHHDEPSSAHGGIANTLERLRGIFIGQRWQSK